MITWPPLSLPAIEPLSAAQSRRASYRRKADAAKFRLHLQRHGSLAARRDIAMAHVRPFAGRRDLAQPVANVLLRQQPVQRQQRLGAQIVRAAAQFQQARIAARQLTSNSESGSRRPARTRPHPPADKRPPIAGVDDAQAAADLLELGARAVRRAW